MGTAPKETITHDVLESGQPWAPLPEGDDNPWLNAMMGTT